MTPSAAISMLDRQIADHGEPVTLRRIGSPDTTQAVRAFVRHGNVGEVVQGGDPAQTRTMVALSPTGLTLVPLRGDQADIAGRRVTIEDVKPIRIGASVVRYNLEVSG